MRPPTLDRLPHLSHGAVDCGLERGSVAQDPANPRPTGLSVRYALVTEVRQATHVRAVPFAPEGGTRCGLDSTWTTRGILTPLRSGRLGLSRSLKAAPGAMARWDGLAGSSGCRVGVGEQPTCVNDRP